MAAPVMSDDSIPLPEEVEHLSVPVIGAQWPAMMEDEGLRVLGAPVFVEDCHAVLRGNRAHLNLLSSGSSRFRHSRWQAAYESDRLRPIELGSGREALLEDLGTEFPRHAREQLGLASTHQRPRAQSGALPQPVGGTQRGGGSLGISLRESELRRGDERKGHALGAELHG